MKIIVFLGIVSLCSYSGQSLSGVTNYKYDELGRLVYVEDDLQNKSIYKYDSAGNRVSVSNSSDSYQELPQAPSNLKAVSERCYGGNILTWTESSGSALIYEVWSASSSSFGSPLKIAESISTSRHIDVTSTRYIRVRACNGTNCSEYSNQVVAYYTKSCL